MGLDSAEGSQRFAGEMQNSEQCLVVGKVAAGT
jgi:hypothetical protein